MADGSQGKEKRRVKIKEDGQLQCASSEWYTPPVFIEAAREFMGSIDCDPCSSELANTFVRAGTFYTRQQNGLEQEWHGNVWLNPPSPPKPWWVYLTRELVVHRHAGRAVYLVYSIEQLSQMQNWSPTLHAMSDLVNLCIPRQRIQFLTPAWAALETVRAQLQDLFDDGATETAEKVRKLRVKEAHFAELPSNELVSGAQPTHANAFIGFGNPRKFRKAFGAFGGCR